jgi:thiamine-monophosphate kinase
MSTDKRTTLDKLGEFGLIDRITKPFSHHNGSTVKGVGDDAAVIRINDEEHLLVSTDMLVEGVHFNLMYAPLKHLGYKSVVVNLSDIYAMNGKPEQITVSLAISSRFTAEAIDELYEGIRKACDVYGVDLVGGDTTSSLSGLMISVTAIGRVNHADVVYRSGAKENDLLVVTGDLGGAFVGLQVLEREKEVYKVNPDAQPDLEGHDYILERQLKPEARRDVIQFLDELGVKPTAMIDVSDGLASEVLHICRASGVGCHVYDEKLPIDPTTYNTARDFNLDPSTCALNGGEDYELLFTIKQSDYEKIKGSPHMTVIGHIVEENAGIYIVDRAGALIPMQAQGWNHFDRSE